MDLDESVRQQLDQLVQENEVVLFMKGNRQSPQCGFSATVVGILDSILTDYQTVDVLSEPTIREGVKVYSSWPTIPQLYVKGEFVGGCDIIQEMFGSGELYSTFGMEPVETVPPTLTISDKALEALKQATEQHGGSGRELHLSVDASFQSHLSISPRTAADVEAKTPGILILLDPISASRADGVTIDVADTPSGQAFKVDNPNAPQVQQMSVRELKDAMDAGDTFRADRRAHARRTRDRLDPRRRSSQSGRERTHQFAPSRYEARPPLPSRRAFAAGGRAARVARVHGRA